MNCKTTQKLMLQYIDGELNELLAGEVKGHISGCSECYQQFVRLSRIQGVIDAEKAECQFDPYLSARVLARLSHRNQPHSVLLSSRRYVLAVAFSVAAVFVGVLLGGFFSKVDINLMQIQSDNSMELLAEEYFPTTNDNFYDIPFNENDNENQ